jgi:hypothetical protein
MNPLMILKGAKVFVIAGVIMYGLTMVNDFRKDEQAETDALLTANVKMVSALAHAQTLATANAQLEAVNNAQAESIKQSAIAMAESAQHFETIERNQKEQKSLLEGNRLNNAVRGKRELVERLANRATKERFREVEQIFDGT